MKGFNTDAKTKLVPIDRDLAADCARAGRSTGRGYYATVNERLRAAGHMVPAAPVVRLVAAVTAMLPPQGAPSMLEALAMAEATIERLTVHHGPFSSTQGTLDVVRAAMVTAAAADRAELRGALVDVQRDTDHVDVTPGDGETAKQILRDLYKQFPGFVTDDDVNGGDLVDYISMCAPDIERAMGGPATVQELSVCPDCLEVVAYGDSAENMDADRMGEILAAVTERTRTGAQLIPGEELQEHSRAACHLCGSKIHGARHAVTLFKA